MKKVSIVGLGYVGLPLLLQIAKKKKFLAMIQIKKELISF